VDKRTMHEPSIRIPLVMRFPGWVATNAPRQVDQLVLTLDVAPTVLEACGVASPPNLHGRSWKRLVQTGDPAWRASFLYEYNYERQFPYTPNLRGVRTDRWKYVHSPHGDGGPDRHLAELYDLQQDPEERRNLIGEPAQAAKVKELQAELARLLRETGVERDEVPLDEGIKQDLPDQRIR